MGHHHYGSHMGGSTLSASNTFPPAAGSASFRATGTGPDVDSEGGAGQGEEKSVGERESSLTTALEMGSTNNMSPSSRSHINKQAQRRSSQNFHADMDRIRSGVAGAVIDKVVPAPATPLLKLSL